MDEERIAGTWRHSWVRNRDNFLLIDLVIYADGVVDCHGLMTVAEFAAKARIAVLRAVYEEVSQRHHLYGFTGEGPYNRDNIRILVAGLGWEIETLSGTEVVTEELHTGSFCRDVCPIEVFVLGVCHDRGVYWAA